MNHHLQFHPGVKAVIVQVSRPGNKKLIGTVVTVLTASELVDWAAPTGLAWSVVTDVSVPVKQQPMFVGYNSVLLCSQLVPLASAENEKLFEAEFAEGFDKAHAKPVG